jgi:hypothetical protein
MVPTKMNSGTASRGKLLMPSTIERMARPAELPLV